MWRQGNLSPLRPCRVGRWRFRDYMMLINMVLFIVIGGIMIYRSVALGASLIAYLLGAGFIAYGGYRFYLLYKVLKGEI